MLIALVLGVSAAALAVAGLLARWVLRQDGGTAEMQVVSDAIQEGAGAFLWRQYRTIGLLSLLLGALIFLLYLLVREPRPEDPGRVIGAAVTTLAFLLGALCSGTAGVLGMLVAVRANVRARARRAAAWIARYGSPCGVGQ